MGRMRNQIFAFTFKIPFIEMDRQLLLYTCICVQSRAKARINLK